MKSTKRFNRNYGRYYRKRTRGFTLIELLVSIGIGAAVVMVILSFVVQLSETDRRELALTQTQRDMSFALEYMSSELKEAIYVYDADCLGTTSRGQPNRSADYSVTPPVPAYCPGLQNHLQFPSQVSPVLAFWKIEPLPYVANAQGNEALPDSCPANATECNAVLLNRSSYTFVMYGIRADSPTGSGAPRWIGPARIVRYELRQYQTVNTLATTPGYIDPTNSGVTFSSWPKVYATGASPAGLTAPQSYDTKEQVLVDLVDVRTLPKEQTTPIACASSDYSLSKPAVNNVPKDDGSREDNVTNSSFYACIRRADDGQSQDVFVSIRGNALKRAGMLLAARNPAYLPGVSAQIQTRGVFNRDPSK